MYGYDREFEDWRYRTKTLFDITPAAGWHVGYSFSNYLKHKGQEEAARIVMREYLVQAARAANQQLGLSNTRMRVAKIHRQLDNPETRISFFGESTRGAEIALTFTRSDLFEPLHLGSVIRRRSSSCSRFAIKQNGSPGTNAVMVWSAAA